MKKSSSGLTKEIEQCKEMIWAKDKALEDAQKSYTRTAKELNRVRSEYGELETLLTRLKVDMQSTATNQSKDRTRIQELSEEVGFCPCPFSFAFLATSSQTMPPDQAGSQYGS